MSQKELDQTIVTLLKTKHKGTAVLPDMLCKDINEYIHIITNRLNILTRRRIIASKRVATGEGIKTYYYYPTQDYPTQKKRTTHYASRQIIKIGMLEDWERIERYFNDKSPLRIRWFRDPPYSHVPFFPSGHSWSPINEPPTSKKAWVTISVLDNLNWFFNQGGRDATRFRLVHEAIHRFRGIMHDPVTRSMGYFSRGWKKDIFTRKVYRIIFHRVAPSVAELIEVEREIKQFQINQIRR